jgi:hypothetical protein
VLQIRRILVLVFLQLLPGLVVPSALGKSKTAANPVDSEYVSALGTANDFLHAWQTQDREAGILLLTDRVKQGTPEDSLVRFFSRTACKAQSFEIQRGRKLGPGRYRFPVSLFQQPAAAREKWMRPQLSSLVVVRRRSNEWSIDKLP